MVLTVDDMAHGFSVFTQLSWVFAKGVARESLLSAWNDTAVMVEYVSF